MSDMETFGFFLRPLEDEGLLVLVLWVDDLVGSKWVEVNASVYRLQLSFSFDLELAKWNEENVCLRYDDIIELSEAEGVPLRVDIV